MVLRPITAMLILQLNVVVIERFNRDLRYFYPKGTRFEHISSQDLTTTTNIINKKPLLP